MSAFETMQTRLKRFVGERTCMLAAIAHDLRTPLTRHSLQAEFIGDRELREGMLANIDAVRDMLTETLSFAEGDASTDASASFDLASILISLCDEASDAGAQAEYDGPNHVTAFAKRTGIPRMFSNLIDNAVRYGGAARVSLREDATDWIVGVAMTGRGYLPNPSSRLSDRSRGSNLRATGRPAARARSIDRPRHCACASRADFARQRVPRSGGLVVSVLLPKASPPRARATSHASSCPPTQLASANARIC
jgi:light-regulated signal transduction histidine kinase (bacteriophytochrome)